MTQKRSYDHPVEWLRAAYREALDAEPREIVYPELRHPETGEVFRCYVWPETVAEQDKLQRAAQAGGMEPILQTVMVRAKDRDGNRIFKAAHAIMLRREALASQVVELCLRINAADAPETRNPELVGKS